MAVERKPRRRRRSFTDEFKAGAVQRVLEGGKTIPQVARNDVFGVLLHLVGVSLHLSFSRSTAGGLS